MPNKSSGYSMHALASKVPISQSASISKSRSFSAGLSYSTGSKTNYEVIRPVFETAEHTQMARAESIYQTLSNRTQIPKSTTPSCEVHLLNIWPRTMMARSLPIETSTSISCSSNKHFFHSLADGSVDEMETGEANPPKGKCSDLNPFEA